ncbi:ankyrin repeat domain-containing protein [Cupriavidus malaysiensis]|uniref:Ankyrin repeat domain-containing protein n=1 Tax=Cupriavidus malaysiensis TaxID=367825 RepID=A0ABN4TGN6_9BURK|nr:ankyrin repeat domain-containing protein [Cupriavidus malaysiensis]AOZ05891.1 hypothetical protein BKK80_08705 [Cupriavidus malaysiensis]
MSVIAQRLRTSTYFLNELPGSDKRIDMIRFARNERTEADDYHAGDVYVASDRLDPPCPSCGATMAYQEEDVWTCAACAAAHGEAVLAGSATLPFRGTVKLTFAERDRLFTVMEERLNREVTLAEANAMWGDWNARLQAFVPPAAPFQRKPFAVDLPPEARAQVDRMVEVIDTMYPKGDDLADFLANASPLVQQGHDAMFDALIRAAAARDGISSGTYVTFGIDGTTRDATPLWWKLFRQVAGGDPRQAFRQPSRPETVRFYELAKPLDVAHAWRVLDILAHHLPGCVTVNSILALPNGKRGWEKQGEAAHHAVSMAWAEHRFVQQLHAVQAYRARHPRRPWRTHEAFNRLFNRTWRSQLHVQRLIEAGANPAQTRICTSLLGSGPLLTTIIEKPHLSDKKTAKLVAYLLAHGADVNETASGGETALTNAASAGYLATANVLIAAGADVHHQDDTAWSAGHWAVVHAHFELFERLVAAGLDSMRVIGDYAQGLYGLETPTIEAYYRDYEARILREAADEAPAAPVRSARRRL